MEAVKFLLQAARRPEFRELVKAMKEFRKYVYWKTAKTLVESGVTEVEPRDDISRLTAAVLSDGGFAVEVGGRYRVEEPGEPPRITTSFVAEFIPVVDRVLATLPEALATGRRRLLYAGGDKECKAVFAKFLDNSGYNLIREWAVKWGGFTRLPPGSVVVDVGAGMGLSTKALLSLTECEVVAVDPHPASLDVAESYASLLGVRGRARFVVGRGEELNRVVGEADAALLINVLHWCLDPRRVLSEVRRVLGERGFAVVMQGVYDSKPHRAGNLLTWLMGSSILPSRATLKEWFKDAGLRVKRYTRLPVDTFLLIPA